MNSSVNNASICLISTNTETSVNQVLKIVEEIIGAKAKIEFKEALSGDIRRMRYDYSKAKRTIGYEPKYSPKEGIEKLVNYMQNISKKL